MSLNRRRIKKLEAKRREVKAVPDELLERHYQLMENEQAELEGRPKPHPDPPTEQELEAYFQDLQIGEKHSG